MSIATVYNLIYTSIYSYGGHICTSGEELNARRGPMAMLAQPAQKVRFGAGAPTPPAGEGKPARPAAVSATCRPPARPSRSDQIPVGLMVTIGKMHGRVVRHIENGFAVELTRMQHPDFVEENVTGQ